MATIHLLVTLDQRYLTPLQVLLTSLAINSSQEHFVVHLLHRGIPASRLELVERQCHALQIELIPQKVPESLFQSAPVTKQYPQEMYYRLIAHTLLPENVSRVLYLDPDILVMNSLGPLWETDLLGNLFAAAAHTGKTEFANNLNQIRLGTENNYFNSGVLLIDLEQARHTVSPQDIFDFTEAHQRELVLPDQDILNAMFGSRTLELDDALWNYDARGYHTYLFRSAGEYDLDWVMSHTAILHFCGKSKPWQPGYHYRFGILYKHYLQLSKRWISSDAMQPGKTS